MHRTLPLFLRFLSAACVALLLAPSGQAQNKTASIEFLVQATPSGGRPEKVMRHSFYLLRASLEEIEKQASAEITPPDFNAFVDKLNVSDELKAWMKREKRADLHGAEFIKAVTVDDLMNVPELKTAYVTRNLTMVGLGFPRHPKATDKEKNPQKYEEAVKKYWESVRTYAVGQPESKEQMDDHLVEINPGAAWQAQFEAHQRAVRQKMEQLIYSRYLAGRAETDYEGMARFSGLAPGRYWLTSLWTEVRAGDVHLRWELPVELASGQSLYLELNNANALLTPRR